MIGAWPMEGFDIVVADPPWRPTFGKTCSRSVTRHYETMALEDICAMNVPANQDAMLFLWATAPMLQQGLAVMQAWGFRYRTSMVWCKNTIGTGKWARNQHEHILIGRRGKFPAPPPYRLEPGVIHAKRRRHSEKPEDLQDQIERVYPGMRYIELFARRSRPGWITLGNESQKFDR